MTARSIASDPDTGVPDLIRRLAQDSKRLVGNEVRLAKIEATESVHHVSRGVLWMTLAFGAAVIMFVALTLVVATFIGRLANGHMWIGALVSGVIEIAIGTSLVKRGLSIMKTPSYTLEESRGALGDTASWVASARRR